MDPDDFNLVEQIHDENHIDVDGEQFKQMIDLTNYAAANDDDRPILPVLYWKVKAPIN